MKTNKIEKFWYVMRYQPRTNPQDEVTVPRIRHKTLDDASKEAIRLAKVYPQANFVVLESTHFAYTPPPVIPEPEVRIITDEYREATGEDVTYGSLGKKVKIPCYAIEGEIMGILEPYHFRILEKATNILRSSTVHYTHVLIKD